MYLSNVRAHQVHYVNLDSISMSPKNEKQYEGVHGTHSFRIRTESKSIEKTFKDYGITSLRSRIYRTRMVRR